MITHLTPVQYALQLRMSRTHLYKLIAGGELATVTIDGVSYIDPTAMPAFEARRDRERAQLAYAFAHQHELREAAIDELARHLS